MSTDASKKSALSRMTKEACPFIPHRHCTNSSGGCFTAGRCLDACKDLYKHDDDRRYLALEWRVRDLEMFIAKLGADEIRRVG